MTVAYLAPTNTVSQARPLRPGCGPLPSLRPSPLLHRSPLAPKFPHHAPPRAIHRALLRDLRHRFVLHHHGRHRRRSLSTQKQRRAEESRQRQERYRHHASGVDHADCHLRGFRHLVGAHRAYQQKVAICLAGQWQVETTGVGCLDWKLSDLRKNLPIRCS